MNDFNKQITRLSPAQLEMFAQLLVTRARSQRTRHKIPRRDDPRAPAPLSFAQQRLWFIDQMEPGNSTYNLPAAIRMSGRLDVKALERTLSEVVRRHESLRTRLIVSDGQPLQVVDPPQPLSLNVIDLSHQPKSWREAEARRLSKEAERPFDLATGPLMRAQLLCLADEEHVMLLTMHHVISDAWSVRVFVREVAALYETFSQDQPSPLGELAVQYSDFAVWQRHWLQGEVLEHQLSYWRQQLNGLPPLLKLPTDHLRPPVQTFNGATQRFLLSEGLLDDLRRLSRDEGVTLFMLLLGAFKALLMRYTGQSDVWVGTPVANRPRVETEPLIGFFVNTLVLRTDLSGDPTFIELLDRVSRTCLEAFAHQDLPFERLVEELQPDRDLSRSPLFQVMFALHDASATQLPVLRGIALRELKLLRRTSNFELSFTAFEMGNRLGVSVEYNTDLFERETVRRMARRWGRLLRAVSQRPGARLSEVEWLSRGERKDLLIGYSGAGALRASPTATLASTVFVHQMISDHARLVPDAPAVIDATVLTYGQLESRACQLARYLRRLGVGPETRVGVLCERGQELAISVLGVLKSGGVYVPLDTAHPSRRLAWVLEDCGARVLLVGRGAEAPAKCGASVVRLESVWAEDADDLPDDELSTITSDSMAYIVYTSGSTGNPKGVCATHGALANYVSSVRCLAIGPRDRLLQFNSPSFDGGLEELFICLTSGAALLPRTDEMLSSPRYFIQECTRLGITILDPPTAYWHALMSGTTPEDWHAFETLRLVYVGGECMLPEAVESWWRLTNGRVQLVNGYGPTEATIVATMHELRPGDEACGRVPVGRPIPGTTAYVLDENLQPVPEGVAGELYLGGAGVARGYLNRPDLTAERFIPDPHGCEPGMRLYQTGDVASWREGGVLDYLGRGDEQVKVRGYRVEVSEVEAVLCGHPSVREAVVVAHEAEGHKGGETRLIAYMVPQEEVGPGVAAIVRNYLREHLPDYMIPSIFVTLDHLPLTTSGKIDRRALPAPDTERADIGDDFRPPSTPVEEIVASVWAEVLRVGRVGVHDNFFDLGGHSLLATQAVSRLNEALAVELPLRTLFEMPTIGTLSCEVERLLLNGRPATPPIARAERRDSLPLSFTQQRLWFLQQMEPASGAYNIPGGVRLTGRLDVVALERSLDEVARRHESLRTSFPVARGSVVQRINPPVPVRLEANDLTSLPEAKRESEVKRAMEEEAARPFDLGRGPLWRARLLHLGDQEHILLYTMHHTISDEWSMGVLIQEMAALYKAFASGEQSPLAELTVQYADYAVWQRDWLQGEVLDEQLSYWQRQLEGAPAILDLPSDKLRLLTHTTNGARVNFQLPAELMQQLKELSRQESATLFMTMLAAFEVLLHRYTGQQDIVIGTPVAGRGRREVEGLIGAFINALAIRVDLSGDLSFQELIRRVRSAVLGAFAYHELPFEKLLEVLQPARRAGYAPLFQVVFNYQHAIDPIIELPDLKISFLEVKLEKAKYDLTLYIGEGHDGLSGNLTYKTDLFEATTIEGMLKDFERILIQVATQPEAQLTTIGAGPTDGFKRRELGSVRRKAIRLSPASLVETSYLRSEEAFPLVVQPSVEDLDLAGWAQANGDFIEKELLKHGALLFRGFNVSSVGDFRRFAATVTTDIVNYIEGSSERIALGDQVYTSSEYPADYFISLHNELSYAHKWPGRLFFCCLQPPQNGGETPIADSRKVLNLISPQIKESFLLKGVKYVRNLRAGNGAGLSWQMVFETEDQAFVEGYCREGGIEFEWNPAGGLRTSQVRPAVARHPQTGEMVWFNQADQWHPSNLGGKLASGLVTAMREEDLPINAYYGDGSPFDTTTLDAVRRVYREASVTFSWQKGDVMLLDNMLMAHGRMPFSGPRRVAVVMGAPVALKEIEMAVGTHS